MAEAPFALSPLDEPPPAVKDPAALRDFPDAVPPLLVKELRQALRGQLFAVPFVVLHALLMFSSALAGSAQRDGGFFWLCILAMLIFILPFRNLGALGDEKRDRTLEVLLLTRLTAWRIVWEKWAATAALCLLTAVSVFPYLLVRYIYAGSDLADETGLLLTALAYSGVVTALLTRLSLVVSAVSRYAAAILLVLFSSSVISGFRHGGALETMAERILPLMVPALWAGAYALAQAASQIAPAGAEPVPGRRWTSVAAVLLQAVVCRIFPDRQAGTGMLVILIVTGFTEMSGPMPSVPVAAVFRAGRRGAARAAVWFLQPGWAHGVLLCILLWAAGMVSVEKTGSVTTWAALCFFPVTARLFLPARIRYPAMAMVFLSLLALLGCGLARYLPGEPAPPAAFLVPSLERHGTASQPPWFWTPAAIWAGLALLTALAALRRESAAVRRLAGESANLS